MHRFCWADLATTDDTQAASFYTALFGWSTRTYVIAHGRFDTLSRGDVEFASIYRLARELVTRGVPSHWLPYVSTGRLDETLQRTLDLGGTVIVRPQSIAGLARFAVIAVPTGAPLGVWGGGARRVWCKSAFASGEDGARIGG